jgi:hypothetical protein
VYQRLDQALAELNQRLGGLPSELPPAFRFKAVCVVSDGITVRFGTAFTPYEHFSLFNPTDSLTSSPAMSHSPSRTKVRSSGSPMVTREGTLSGQAAGDSTGPYPACDGDPVGGEDRETREGDGHER